MGINSPWSKADQAAIAALLTHYQREWLIREERQKAFAEAQAAVAESNAKFVNLKAAFSIFGVDTTNTEVWQTVKAGIGEEAYSGALAAAKQPVTVAEPTTEELDFGQADQTGATDDDNSKEDNSKE